MSATPPGPAAAASSRWKFPPRRCPPDHRRSPPVRSAGGSIERCRLCLAAASPASSSNATRTAAGHVTARPWSPRVRPAGCEPGRLVAPAAVPAPPATGLMAHQHQAPGVTAGRTSGKSGGAGVRIQLACAAWCGADAVVGRDHKQKRPSFHSGASSGAGGNRTRGRVAGRSGAYTVAETTLMATRGTRLLLGL
jgi:hypothetical protein